MASLFRRFRVALGMGEEPGQAGAPAVRVRGLAYADLDAVLAIEASSFGSPWRRSTYSRIVGSTHHTFIVAELGGETIAYAGFWVEGHQAHIAKVAVHADHRRRGIATLILTDLLGRARRLGLTRAYLEVRRSNTVAQELYRRFGFHFERVQPRAYPNNGEDAFVLVRDDLLDIPPLTSR